MTPPFTIHFKQQRDGKMSGEIKFKGHPCMTFNGKSWIQKPFYLNMVAILNISQQNETRENDSDMDSDSTSVLDSMGNDN
jgi:hypothetical protein